MRRYLIDTGPLAALLHNRPPVVQRITPWMLRDEAASSVLTYAEIVEYVAPRPGAASHQRALKRLLREIYPYSLTYGILERYAHIRLALRPPYGTGLIGDIDTLIAATALEHGLTVVTLDRDFLRVPDLSVMLLDRTSFAIAEHRNPVQ